MNIRNIKIGQRVYWNDPDESTDCSGYGNVIDIKGSDKEAIVVLKKDNGEVECFAHELTLTKSH